MAQLNWKELLTPWRQCGDGSQEKVADLSPDRSPFAADIDRIIFSDSFRRLSRKSQVHPLALNDHLHNRLSHSLEVSSVGRSLGCAAGFYADQNGELPAGLTPAHVGEIVQAACLSHDIGNPPFGHAGEEALREWAENPENHNYLKALNAPERTDFLYFDGNAQGFRVITKLEMAGPVKGGLKLAWPVLATMVKYPWASHEAERRGTPKYNYHCSEAEIFDRVFSRLGLRAAPGNYVRHPLSYLTEAADDICYSVIDLEDALELRLIDMDEFVSIYRNIDGVDDILASGDEQRRKVSYIRALAIGRMIGLARAAFIRHYTPIMNGELEKSLADNDDGLLSLLEPAKALARKRVYSEKRKVALEIGSHTIYEALLDAFIPAVHGAIRGANRGEDSFTPYKQRKALELLHTDFTGCTLYEGYRRVIDYITGMTDSYATFLAQQFLGSGTGPWQM